jgi:hypothetical protein
VSHVIDLPLAEGDSIKVEVDEAPVPLQVAEPIIVVGGLIASLADGRRTSGPD